MEKSRYLNLDGTPWKQPTCVKCGAKRHGDRGDCCELCCPHGEQYEIESDPHDGRYGLCYGCGKDMELIA